MVWWFLPKELFFKVPAYGGVRKATCTATGNASGILWASKTNHSRTLWSGNTFHGKPHLINENIKKVMCSEENWIFQCSFAIRQICLLNEPLLPLNFSCQGMWGSKLPSWSFASSHSSNLRQVAVCVYFVLNPKYLLSLIHIQAGSALPNALRIQTTHSTQGLRWHTAYHQRVFALWFVVSLHTILFLLAL